MEKVCFELIHPDAIAPAKGSEYAAAYDLYACEDKLIFCSDSGIVGTGIRLAMPNGICAVVQSRSGLATKEKISVLNSPGLIDPDYRGEIKVILYNHSSRPYRVVKGDRVAQLRFVQIPEIALVSGQVSADTARGAGGLGSTGV